MTNWENVETLFETSDTDEAYNALCESATPADFYFAAFDGEAFLAKRGTLVQIVPKSFFDKHERVQDCPLFVDDMMDKALPDHTVKGYENNLYVLGKSVKTMNDAMKAAGFTESKALLEHVAETIFAEL